MTSEKMVDEVKARLGFAIRTAREAGALTLRFFQQTDLDVKRKIDRSPVTRADMEAEHLIRRSLANSFSADAIIGEELGEQIGSTGYTWYLDPIDGTESFIRGVPLFGTMIGLEHDEESVAGVIVFPALGELVYGGRGGGTWYATGQDISLGSRREDQPSARVARVSKIDSLGDACFSTTSVQGFDDIGQRVAFDRLHSAVRVSRGWTDCYGHYLVATGRIDVMVDPIMSVWDNAPLKPIVEGAGGRFTSLTGGPTIHAGSALSTNGILHGEVLSAING